MSGLFVESHGEHITPVLEDLHWLPVSQRVVFKTALIVWKCVHGVAPAYLSDLCIPATAISGRQHLWSAATGTLLVPHARTATEQRSFAVNGPATWNCLPAAPRSRDCLQAGTDDALVLDRPAPLKRLHDSAAGCKYPGLLTYLLAHLGCRRITAAKQVCCCLYIYIWPRQRVTSLQETVY